MVVSFIQASDPVILFCLSDVVEHLLLDVAIIIIKVHHLEWAVSP